MENNSLNKQEGPDLHKHLFKKDTPGSLARHHKQYRAMAKTNQLPAQEEITKRQWRWIGHTLRKPAYDIKRQSLKWNPQGKRKRGRPRNTWCRDLEADSKRLGLTWSQLETKAKDRDVWRNLIGGLCPRRGDSRK
jgi:hypothetical protein